VTGVRHDAYAKARRIPTEEFKSEAERGTYLHPDLFTAKLPPQPRWPNARGRAGKQSGTIGRFRRIYSFSEYGQDSQH
jgi:hypothetical protein